ncbi:MAG: V-type ATP synthase subunit A [Sulfolobales archaeon]|nr:V-type ATP synthase subunit A [Sulfolobales archaeon]MDW8010942.1 V-type ATP synthase subunit A [Sulfolobales archaeon]
MSGRTGRIYRISGPLVVAEGLAGVMMYEVVRVGDEGLIGEVIAIRGDRVFIQVYEETSGLTVGEKVVPTGRPLSAELGPGLVSSIYDGLQRPEKEIGARTGSIFIKRGVSVPPLNREIRWGFERSREVKTGDKVLPGDVVGFVKETPLVLHKIMVPPEVSGYVKWVAGDGDYTLEDSVAIVSLGDREYEVKMYQSWPIRKPRPYAEKLSPVEPLITGIRVIDYVFPIAKGGKAAIPGGFGTGKTVALQEITKWSHADIAIYVGCGERGNEMSDALTSFMKLLDPRRGRPMMERSVFIANTSNMPVAARETSVFLGVTIGEYFRDMGYDVVMVADSTSRWAEAMREISGRMEEMPGEEGFPAYLSSRLAEFYERAGRVRVLGRPERSGSLTIFGAVSPPGGDFSEPVVRSTVRYVQCFYALDYGLATRRHFPAINWLISYSLYTDFVKAYWNKLSKWSEYREAVLKILQREAELSDIVRLVGPEALPEEDKLVLEVSRMVREDFLQQSALNPVDAYSPPEKDVMIMEAVMEFYRAARRALMKGVTVAKIRELKSRAMIAQMKYYTLEQLREGVFEKVLDSIRSEFKGLLGE